MTGTVKPSGVGVTVPKVGVSAAPVIDVAETEALPSVWLTLLVATTTVAEVPGATPVTVTRPVPLMLATAPAGAVAVASHVKDRPPA